MWSVWRIGDGREEGYLITEVHPTSGSSSDRFGAQRGPVVETGAVHQTTVDLAHRFSDPGVISLKNATFSG
jgi:hypothetical protein